jgi:hypothetical protein
VKFLVQEISSLHAKYMSAFHKNIVTKLFPWNWYYMDIPYYMDVPKSPVSWRNYQYPYSSASSSCQGLGLSDGTFMWSGYRHHHNP